MPARSLEQSVPVEPIERHAAAAPLAPATLRHGGDPRVRNPNRRLVVLSLVSVYLIWGSTYLAIAIALQGFPPFFMAAWRFLFAGGGLFLWLRLRGVEAPSRHEWAGATLIGGLMLLGGNGGVVFAQQYVSSSTTAMAVASTPLWVTLFTGFSEGWPRPLEWLGIIVGFVGIVLLNLGGELRVTPIGASALLFSQLTWAVGSTLNRRLRLPAGLMASAAQMLAGGALLLLLSLGVGEELPQAPPLRAVLALAYLVLFGAVVGFSAFNYLIRNVRPALATSNAYVNPVVALLLGVGIAGERVTASSIAAMVAILAGVGLVMLARER